MSYWISFQPTCLLIFFPFWIDNYYNQHPHVFKAKYSWQLMWDIWIQIFHIFLVWIFHACMLLKLSFVEVFGVNRCLFYVGVWHWNVACVQISQYTTMTYNAQWHTKVGRNASKLTRFRNFSKVMLIWWAS
jgi:hypothetical protein